MRLETLPVILGILFVVAGLALVADGLAPDGALVRPDRRRSPRPQRHHAGEGMLGAGIACVGVALIGRDAWRYGTVAILVAFILCVVGVVLNWRYVRGMMLVGTGVASDADDRPAPTRAPTPAADLPTRPPEATTVTPPGAAPPDGGHRPERRMHAR